MVLQVNIGLLLNEYFDILCYIIMAIPTIENTSSSSFLISKVPGSAVCTHVPCSFFWVYKTLSKDSGSELTFYILQQA